MKYEDLVAAALAALNNQNSAAEGHRDPPNPKRNFEIADERKAGAVDSKAADKRGRKRIKKVEHRFPVEPQIIQICKKAKAYVNHSYCDFSSVPPEMDYKDVEAIEEMSFSRKLHDILSKKEFQECISWLPHGRAFKKFMFPRAWNKPSFLRQLSNYGFKHILSGRDRNSYYHECMLQGMPHLTKYMPPVRDSRRELPHPESEPDFYTISKIFPLPEDKAWLLEKVLVEKTVAAQQSLTTSTYLADSLSSARIVTAPQFPANLIDFAGPFSTSTSLVNTIPRSTLMSTNDPFLALNELLSRVRAQADNSTSSQVTALESQDNGRGNR
ncbi:predicted protein [Phaeodactylum tricornutum CCAP 1055/1]|uniref:HSF-type DNA-binding domain-containing protein n=1 Tax=Phaeodactylum tricornutum (strain CCAP 1055/1) TaxID=556484 RepID=B7FY36_PHATC|nr:predicted protein [Phaeodactylum tricornutum CCAP 1055/1]EEC48853.1 predicted protein [Phaeodactylum tricornutum CCAP 1055/1]|eukprot:XP_002179867.1 predicted protein [Phaeodactylum tricornutum CCAP 1055/1]